jgi:Flp pilus assembly protein TadG
MTEVKQRSIRIPSIRAAAGQGLVEFALILPIFLLLVIGALDFGMAFYAKVVLTNSAREGANFMVYNRLAGMANSFEATKVAVQTEGQNSGFTIDTADIQVQCLVGGVVDNTCSTGSTVVVTVTHDMELLVDVIFHGPLQLMSEARMMIP